MVLTKETESRIVDFVRASPRTIQEIARALGKNWRTADAYVERISRENGTIATRTFRGGTRGALKIAYINAINVKGSAYQERLLEKIKNGKRKEDFSPFDIYQFATQKNAKRTKQDPDLLLKTEPKQQLLFFSGNLTFAFDKKTTEKLEQLAKRKIQISILTRIDLSSIERAQKIININKRAGWDAIRLRHCEQPLRALIIDDNKANIKEILTPEKNGVKKKTNILYEITDPEWLSFLQKTFWHLWEQSVDAQTRLDALNEITTE